MELFVLFGIFTVVLLVLLYMRRRVGQCNKSPYTTVVTPSNIQPTDVVNASCEIAAMPTSSIEDITRQHEQSEAQLRQQLLRLQKLSDLSMALVGEPNEVFNNIVRVAAELLEVQVVCLLKIDGDELEFISVCENGSVIDDNTKHLLELTPCAAVVSEKQLLIYDNVTEQFPKAKFLSKYAAHSYCGIPAFDSEGNVVAVTCLLDNKPHEFKNEDKHLLHIITQRIGVEIERQQHIAKSRQAEQSLQQSEERLQYLAHHDELTGLPNRTLFLDRLQQAMAHSGRDKNKVIVMFLDLDRFKVINDTLGHEVGDELLLAVAERLTNCVRGEDTVARFGGDEFVVLLTKVKYDQDADVVAKKIIKEIQQSFMLDERELFVTTSIGVSVHPNDGHDAFALIKNADIAMYRAKDQGRNNYQFYASNMNDRATEILNLENGLRRALARDEFILHYQPKIDLKSGKMTGMEALIRWCNPSLGLVPPGQFIPLLEETGLIQAVGEWALHTACLQNKTWQDAGFEPLRVAVNLSARQFRDVDLAAKIFKVLGDTGLDTKWLELEITESLLMENKDVVVDTLRALDQHGVSIALDDFGTGYSSLHYLKRFPIHIVKIDQSFIRDIIVNPDDALITGAIIKMAHTLNMRVVAEGVETKQQLSFLLENRCDECQGYYISKPVSVEAFTKLLEKNFCLDMAEFQANMVKYIARS